jgi:hypothetical protein
VGDVQLKAFFSWVHNEEERVEKLQKYKEEEIISHLWVREKETRP